MFKGGGRISALWSHKGNIKRLLLDTAPRCYAQLPGTFVKNGRSFSGGGKCLEAVKVATDSLVTLCKRTVWRVRGCSE